MPLVAAAVAPHPPLLVPAVAAGAAPELADVRAACREALAVLAEAAPERLVVVGGGASLVEHRPGARGSFRDYGVDLDVPLFPDAGPPTKLPLSLAVAAYLLDDTPIPLPLSAWEVPADGPTNNCAALGRRLVADGPTALLVMGDGAARLGEKAPGYVDPRAEPYEAAVSAALDAADTAALLALDPDLSAQLLAAGRAAWQVLAGAAGDRADWQVPVRYHCAPYGVGYHVVAWTAP